jgi:hypothetical protein
MEIQNQNHDADLSGHTTKSKNQLYFSARKIAMLGLY